MFRRRAQGTGEILDRIEQNALPADLYVGHAYALVADTFCQLFLRKTEHFAYHTNASAECLMAGFNRRHRSPLGVQSILFIEHPPWHIFRCQYMTPAIPGDEVSQRLMFFESG